MNLERLRWGDWIAAIAGLDLLLVTFRAWYKVSGGSGRVTAWDALDNGKILLIATGVVGIFLLLLKASEEGARMSFPPGWIAALVGFACTVYVAYRLATPPADTLDPDIGLFLGLASAVGVALGGLLSAREPGVAPAAGMTASELAQDTYRGPTGPGQEPLGELVPDSGATWSGGGGASTTGWSPAAPTAPVPPATTAGGAGLADADRPLRAGDQVALTTGGARFPAGTLAEVVEVFGGGALVEVKAPDGVAERFEVPDQAFERAPAGGAAATAAPPTEATSPSTSGESWSPAMPAAASETEDWGFDEAAPAEQKTPWWKREIGGGKKKDAEIAAAAGAGVAAGAALGEHEAATDGEAEQKPGFFKRLFGGGAKDQAAETGGAPDAETTAVEDVGGVGPAAESDTAVHEPATADAAEPEPIAAPPEPEPEPVAATPEPEPEPPAPEPVAAAPEPEPEPIAAAPEPEPEPAAPEPEPEPPAPEPEPEPPAAEPEPIAAAPDPEPDPIAAVPEPEPEPAEPEPEPPAPEPIAAAPDPEPEPAAEPDVVVTPDPEPEPPAPEPELAAPDAAANGAAEAAADEPKPKPKRKRSSGSRKVPKEAVAAAGSDEGAPKVGDEVQLKVSGGKFDAGTRGTVVDVFSAGVIVELGDNEGNVERLDLPFEAVGPADA